MKQLNDIALRFGSDLEQYCEQRGIDYLIFLERSEKHLSKQVGNANIDYTLLINDVVDHLSNNDTLIGSFINNFNDFRNYLSMKLTTIIHKFEAMVTTLQSDKVVAAISVAITTLLYVWIKEYMLRKEYKELDNTPQLSYNNAVYRLFKKRPDIVMAKYGSNYTTNKYAALLSKFVPSHPVATIDVDLSLPGFIYNVTGVSKSIVDTLGITVDKFKILIKQAINKEVDSGKIRIKDLESLTCNYDLLSKDIIHIDQNLRSKVNDIVTFDIIKPSKALTLMELIALTV